MIKKEENLYKRLSIVFEEPFYWAIILALENGPETEMTMLDIKRVLVEFEIVRSLDQAWILIQSELKKLKADGFAESPINEEDKFMLTPKGRKIALKVSELIDLLNSSK